MANRSISPRLRRMLVDSSIVAVAVLASAPGLLATTEFFAEPTWQAPDAESVYRQLDDYLRSAGIQPDQQTAVRNLWWEGTTTDALSGMLDPLVACLALADDRVAELVAYCSKPEPSILLPDFSWLADSQTPPLVRHNARLYYARWLAQNNYEEEALAWSDGLTTADVVAPEALLFYRAVASHRLVQTDQADATLAVLLQRSDDLPLRYQQLAVLMQQDLAGLDDESLDHIARRMADIRRRLTLGRAGKSVQEVEKGVVDSLDNLIKKLEEQAQQQQGQAGAAGGQPSGTPMEDSRLAELKAPGRVEPRDIGHRANWGNMPDKDREQALQDIGREFPSHYREVIEEYFRRLAAEPSDDKP